MTVYVGFADLAELIASADASLPVYAAPVTEPRARDPRAPVPDAPPVDLHTILVGLVPEPDRVHHCRILVDIGSRTGLLSGQPPAGDRAQAAWRAVHACLAVERVTCLHAAVALPQGLRLLEGDAGCIPHGLIPLVLDPPRYAA